MKQKILNLIAEKPKHYPRIIKKDSNLIEWINENSLVISEHLPTKIHSAIHQETNVCKYGNIKKFDRASTGFVGCGPASVCKCTSEKISNSVSISKKTYSEDTISEINEKRKATMLEKYGCEYNSQREEIKEKLSSPKIPLIIHDKLSNFDWLNEEYNNKQKSLSEIAEEIGVYYSTVGEYCKKFGFQIRASASRSIEENQIVSYIESLGFYVEISNRSIIAPKELDIFIPSKNIAIELNGLYWHSHHPSSGQKENRLRHVSKTQKSSQAGIKLIHITDYEWNTKQDIIKSLIKSKLGMNKKVYARSCTIQKVDSAAERQFLEKYHIQGHVASMHAEGLYYKNELIMLMSLSKSRFNNIANYEILRMCSKDNITVVGGVSRLLSHIKKTFNNSSFVSYCDLSKGTGEGYLKAGFILLRNTGPGYFWTDGTNVYSRYKCQKKQLQKWLIGFDNSLSETVNLFNLGYRRYWDCGNAVFFTTS